MKRLFLFFVVLSCISCSVKTINLDWNKSWRTDVPYELEFDSAKLGSSSWIAVADDKPLPTIVLDDASEKMRLRFSVPVGTEKLCLRKHENKSRDSRTIDNIFTEGELIAKVPSWSAGKPARIELDVENKAELTYGVKLHFIQKDSLGNILPEEVSDGRWTTHFQPPHVITRYREAAYIHPKAATVELKVDISPINAEYDNYGNKLEKEVKPDLAITRVVLRPAAEFPFPGLNPDFFEKGISDAEFDKAIKLGEERQFWFQTRSMASWAGSVQMRDPSTFFYPIGEGTVEAWFKPEWSGEKAIPLFEASHHASTVYGPRFALGRLLYLTYTPQTKTMSLKLSDSDMRNFKDSVQVDIPCGKWSHIAVTFEPGESACAFINGDKIMEFSLKGYKTLDIENVEFPNDKHAMEFYLGSSYVNTRGFSKNDRIWQKIVDYCDTQYSGLADDLRVSSIVRYSDNFVPQTAFVIDSDTRALFGFDDSFDGLSGCGIGWISGTVLCNKNRISHVLKTNVGKRQYYPDDFEDIDIKKHLITSNHPEVPDNLNVSYINKEISLNVRRGEVFSVDISDDIVMDYVEIANTGDSTMRFPVVIKEGEVDFRSYGDIAETLEGDGPNALFNYLIGASDYFMTYQAIFPPFSDSPHCVKDESLEVLGSYCGFECGPLNRMLMTLYSASCGYASNPLWGYGHAFQQVFYKGKNRLYDLSAQKYFPSLNNTEAACLGDIEVQPGILKRLGIDPGHYIRMGSRSYGAESIVYPARYGMILRPGEKIRFWWGNNGEQNDLQFQVSDALGWKFNVLKEDYSSICHSDIPVWKLNRLIPEHASSFYEFDGRPSISNPAFEFITDESFCYRVESCYPIVSASYAAYLVDGTLSSLEISTDGGKTFRPFSSPADYEVRARQGYHIKVCSPIDSIKRFCAVTQLQTNPRVQTGQLHRGKNRLSFKADSGESAKISFRYRKKASDISFEGTIDYGSIPGYEHRLLALDPDNPQKVKLKGVGNKVEVIASEGVDARIDEGFLYVSSSRADSHFGYVTIRDGEREQTLDVLVAKGVRVAESETTEISKTGKVAFEFPEITAESCAVLCLNRFPGGVFAQRKNVADLEIDGRRMPSCAGINQACNYYKAPFGRKGGRGNWKWDFPLDPSHSYPFDEMLLLDLNKCKSAEYLYTGEDSDGLVELAAMLIIPNVDNAFRSELIKRLCSLNSRPASVR